MFRALSVRNYRLYASGQVVSNTGTWMARVTQDWLVYHILTHDNSFALGFVTALQFLPALAFGMYGGMLGDRYPKRVVLTITQSAMAVMSLLCGNSDRDAHDAALDDLRDRIAVRHRIGTRHAGTAGVRHRDGRARRSAECGEP